MYCGECGSKISDDAKFCPACGAKTENAQRIRDALPPQTILHGQYLLGAALGGGGRVLTMGPFRPRGRAGQVILVAKSRPSVRAVDAKCPNWFLSLS